MANKHMKKFLLPLITGKTQIKTTLQVLLILVWMSVIKKIINAGKKVGGEVSHTTGRKANWSSHYGNSATDQKLT